MTDFLLAIFLEYFLDSKVGFTSDSSEDLPDNLQVVLSSEVLRDIEVNRLYFLFYYHLFMESLNIVKYFFYFTIKYFYIEALDGYLSC